MSKYTLFLFYLIFLIKPSIGFSQFETINAHRLRDSSYAYIDVVGMGSSQSRMPFWVQANQFGIVPNKSGLGSIRGGIQKFWDISGTPNKSSNWKAGFGIEGVGNFVDTTKFLLPQAHATLKFKNWELSVGRRKQWVGLADSTMGSGSYSWSGNTMPIPRIVIGTTKFVNVPFTKGWLSFNAFYSDGLFEKNRPVTTNLKLHQKALYLRIGRENSRLKLYGGANHEAQWGGGSPYFTNDTNRLPDGFKNYLNVVKATLGASGKDMTVMDSTSRIGNHLGSIDFAMEIESYATSLFFYKQFIFEDGSLFYFKALQDGLYGMRIRRKNSYGANFEITEGVFEVLYTKDQGGSEFIIGNNQKRGQDNYFNNQQIRDGWSYYRRTIGTPFIPPTYETAWKYPRYADNHTSNNRVVVLHAGLKGTLFQTVQWYTKLSFSNNYGTWVMPFAENAKQFSGIIALQSYVDVLGGATVRASLAADVGDLYKKTYGFTVGLRKDISF